MASPTHGVETSFDAAALAGATLAAAISIFTKEGPYDWLSGTVGSTLILILYAYERRRPRDFAQTLAFSASFAVAGLLVFGVLAEKFLELQGMSAPQTPAGPDTRVGATLMLTAWVVIAIVCVVADRRTQRR
jgi:hypothetical protein